MATLTQDTLVTDLAAILGTGGVLTDPEALLLHSSDLLGHGSRCRLVIRPETQEQLVAAVRRIAVEGLALMPRGGGLTYVSGYLATRPDWVAVDLRRMNRILSIDEDDMVVTVEAGVTWQQLYEALQTKGLRLPFFGTFSGRGATVGGGLSNGALFLGTARYGTAADIVLGLEVVTADGSVVHTGQKAVARAPKPFLRSFGPDTTGLFIHDAGALGIKCKASLRLIRKPAHTDFLSFAFAHRDAAIAAICEIGRAELAEDAYVMDPDKTRAALSAPADLIRDVRTLGKVVVQEQGLLRGLKAGAKLALAGRDFIEDGCFSLHLVLAGRSRSGLDDDMAAARAIATRFGGNELPNSIPKAGRAELFSPLDAVLGPTGDRWVALNGKVPHSGAKALVDDLEDLLAAHEPALAVNGVEVSRLITIMGNHAFSYEPVFNWHDAWLPMHEATISAKTARDLPRPPANEGARALVMQLRHEIVDILARHGAASNQIGRTYPYASVLRPESRALLEGIKRTLDPDGRMNPGALELG
ncbi:FAD-binding oxidoreductase [Novosphingobium panipatense]|uniref:FAD-binding oxidoreductase n=1 Tax=Novosphingobium panipatense TaxID=428991 RepID=UPI0039A369F8